MSVTAEIKQSTFTVHEPCHVDIIVRADSELTVGDKIEFQFPQSWAVINGPSFTRRIQATRPTAEHFVNVTIAHDNALFALNVRPRTLHYPEGACRHGRHVVATLKSGKVPAHTAIRILYANTFAPYIVETSPVWIRVNGEAPAHAPELTTTPGPETSLRVLAPSGAVTGQPFHVLLVSLDRFDNVSTQIYRDETLTLSDGTIVAPPVTFTGRVKVPVTLNEPGIYRFRFRNLVSNAVRVGETCTGPYWGDMHIHTELSHDGQGPDPYPYARETSGLDFAAAADHNESLGQAGYRTLLRWVRLANDPGRFVALPADERNPHELSGHHNIYYRDEETFLHNRYVSQKRPQTPSARATPLDPDHAMVVPHHTGIGFGAYTDPESTGTAVRAEAWDDPSGLRPVMEIYSHHGQSETYAPQHALAYEFNRARRPERRGNTSVPGPFYAQDYWMQGLRFGVIASSDEHSGQGGRRHGGIAAVRAPELTREAIFDAIRARDCYGTTGERILVEFHIDDTPMGHSLECRTGQEVHLSLKVWGTDLLVRVDILRFRFGQDTRFQPLLSVPPRPESMDTELTASDVVTGPCMYYARITQEPLEWPDMAWTSPVWIDVAG